MVNWQLINRLKFYWQLTFALGLTDNWNRTWLSFIFPENPFWRPFNSNVPLFSSDNVIKCAFICLILAAGRSTVIFCLWFPVRPMSFAYHPLYWRISNLRSCQNAPAYTVAPNKRLIKAIVVFLLRWFRYGLAWSFLRSTSPYFEGINIDWLNGWKCRTLSSKDIRVEKLKLLQLENWWKLWYYCIRANLQIIKANLWC